MSVPKQETYSYKLPRLSKLPLSHAEQLEGKHKSDFEYFQVTVPSEPYTECSRRGPEFQVQVPDGRKFSIKWSKTMAQKSATIEIPPSRSQGKSVSTEVATDQGSDSAQHPDVQGLFETVSGGTAVPSSSEHEEMEEVYRLYTDTDGSVKGEYFFVPKKQDPLPIRCVWSYEDDM